MLYSNKAEATSTVPHYHDNKSTTCSALSMLYSDRFVASIKTSFVTQWHICKAVFYLLYAVTDYPNQYCCPVFYDKSGLTITVT